jgi:hypothetical protein
MMPGQRRNEVVMRTLGAALLVVGVLSWPVLAGAPDTSRPWLKRIATPDKLAGIHTIGAEAAVEVSDGTGFHTAVVYHDPQRAAFRIQDADRNTTMGIEGKYVWSFDGTAEIEADPFVREFVLGHQFHAQILFYDRLYPDHEDPRQTTFEDRPCSVVTTGDEESLRSLYYDPAGLPLGMRMHHGPEMRISIRFGDWRKVGGVSLPFLVWIDDGKAQFEYHYTEVRLNEGSLAEFRAPLDRLTDEQALLRLHRVFMDGHLFGRSSGMQEGLAENVVIVSRGEVHPLSGDETLQTLKGVLARTDYTVYDDLIRPVVRVSDDGSLGWVIVQVAAGGVRLDEQGKPAGPIEFVSAWVELYEKVDGTWRMNGNVSNFRS